LLEIDEQGEERRADRGEPEADRTLDGGREDYRDRAGQRGD